MVKNRREALVSGALLALTATRAYSAGPLQEVKNMKTNLLDNDKSVPFAMSTPVRVARVGLKSKNKEALAQYYRDIVGLREMARRDNSIILGSGERELLEIEQFSSGKADVPRSAGLYHTAFLMPKRSDLARWTKNIIDNQVAVVGASDHNVSEAFYLTDPEGNGIEIYTDRPQDIWEWNDSRVVMGTQALDINNLLDELKRDNTEWQSAPDDMVVGHVHLRVGNAAKAETFWHNQLGFDTVQSYGDKAVFLSTGGYHHHIAANSWQSAGAERRDPDRTGLSFVELEDTRGGNGQTFEDPWGNQITTIKV